MSFTRFYILVVLLAVPSIVLAQQVDTIRANPNAVKLRKIWMVRGSVNGGDNVGDGAGGLGDIFGTGYSAWAVRYGKLGQWRVYRGGPEPLSTEPVWTMDSAAATPSHPVVGHFTDDGKVIVGFMHIENRTRDGHTVRLYKLNLFGVDSGHIASQPRFQIDPSRMMPEVVMGPSEMMAVDLDNDGYDELVLVTPSLLRNGVESNNGEIWIYKGGPGFQVDTPSVVVRDDEAHSASWYYGAILGDFDGDHRLDLLIGGRYDKTWKLKFYWSSSTSPSSWALPGAGDRRVVIMDTDHPALLSPLITLDCDGDHTADLLLNGVELYRSGSGKSAHTRDFTFSDADEHFERYGSNYPERCPYLNDSSRRFQMVAMTGPSRFNAQSTMLMLFSGGEHGPDHAYDAYYDGVLDGLIEGSVFGYVMALEDCSGDGWPDLLVSNSGWYNFSGSSPGIAMILAGGPYIPRDSTFLGVRDIAIAGREAAVSYWPNPMRAELHIAWRGDLKQMPAIMEVHDIVGRLIARQPLESWSGNAVWQCSAISAGTYLLSLFDDQGRMIATTALLKR